MIDERVFSAHFSDFWRANLPNLEAVTRSTNIGYDRISPPFEFVTNPYRRDLISEGAYRYFLKLLVEPSAGRAELRTKAIDEAKEYLLRSFPRSGEPIDEADEREIDEIERLVRWLALYFFNLGGTTWRAMIKQPRFKGHGLLVSCVGDFEIDNTLVEMKYVDRGFRSHDLRQVLVYAGLRYFEDGATFAKIILLNPLLGVAFSTSPHEIIYSASGNEFFEFFQSLSYALSSGEISH